jgi:NAD(P)H-dependent flavin oxidoreductase YrpB (nitropropane dioxygenase family)
MSVTTPELVAAVSNTGGLGMLGAGRMLPNQILDAIHKIKKLTNHRYRVNLLLAPPNKKEADKENVFDIQQFLDRSFSKVKPKDRCYFTFIYIIRTT